MTTRGGEALLDRLSEEHVGVYGFGTTGQAVVRHLVDRVDALTVLDDADPEDGNYDPDDWPDSIHWRIEPRHFQNRLDRVVISPGVPGDHPFVRQAREADVPVWGELELAYRLCEGTIWGITGTNGKSTCVELVGAALRARDGTRSVAVCGNRGEPFLDKVLDEGISYDDYVVEISSFQVEGMDRFSPDASLLTNLGDDHQDRHGSLYEYHGLKWQLLKRTVPGGRIVVPARYLDGRRDWLSGRSELVTVTEESIQGSEADLRVDDGALQLEDGSVSLDALPPVLRWFPENLLGSLGLVSSRPGVEHLRKTLDDFESPPHRVEELSTGGDVRVINDSKATNPDAVRAVLEKVGGPIRIVLGGDDKNAQYAPLVEALDSEPIRAIHLCGRGTACEPLEVLLDEQGLVYQRDPDWEAGVKIALRDAGPGELVLLAPGATSFDAFSSYRERGEAFRRWVREEFGP